MKKCSICEENKCIDELVKQNKTYKCFDCLVDENNDYYFGTKKTKTENTAGLLKWAFG